MPVIFQFVLWVQISTNGLHTWNVYDINIRKQCNPLGLAKRKKANAMSYWVTSWTSKSCIHEYYQDKIVPIHLHPKYSPTYKQFKFFMFTDNYDVVPVDNASGTVIIC